MISGKRIINVREEVGMNNFETSPIIEEEFLK